MANIEALKDDGENNLFKQKLCKRQRKLQD